MSKIFDAYRKQARSAPDFGEATARAGSIALFPGPAEKQKPDFSKLANRLLGLRMEDNGSAICFASSSAGEGASFVSFNTANVLAHDYSQKVAWVDGNFLSPQKSLNSFDTTSFSNLIKKPEMVADLVVDTNPFLIPGGSDLVGARGFFAGENYSRLIRELGKVFDFVIIDLPPVLKSTDTALMAKGTEGLLLVVEQRFLKWEVINHGVDSLREKKVNVLGSVINRRTYDLPKIIYDRL
jgi:Mrp family chromosome partitioning ATPase